MSGKKETYDWNGDGKKPISFLLRFTLLNYGLEGAERIMFLYHVRGVNFIIKWTLIQAYIFWGWDRFETRELHKMWAT